MKDINEVLAAKQDELTKLQQLIYCLKYVAPFLAEPGDVLPEEKK